MTLAPPSERFDVRLVASRVTASDAERAAKDFGLGGVRSVRALSGGFSNANFRVDTTSGSFVLRYFWNGRTTGEREVAVLGLCSRHGIDVPRVHDFRTDEHRTVALLECVEGELFSDALAREKAGHEASFHEAGRQLAQVHAVAFPAAGLFDAQARVFREFPDFPQGCLEHLEAPFQPNGRGRARLGERDAERLLTHARKNWHRVRKAYVGPRLTHCDFNPKNLILRGDGRVALIDWEFAMVADPLIDVGNFFRFAEDDYGKDAKPAFVRGYGVGGGILPDDWEDVARLVDLAAMADFLGVDADYQKTFATARLVVDRSLSRG